MRPMCVAAALFVAAWMPASPSHAQQPQAVAPSAADLNITPKRLTFTRGQQTATAYIFNRGSSPATVDVSVIDRVMAPSGEIAPLDQAGRDPQFQAAAGRLRSARSLVIVSPRRVTLQPGRGQTIRVRVTPPPGDAPGEYRSHLTVAMVPAADTGLTAEDAAAGRPDQLSFRVTSIFGVSIPIIVRTRDVAATAAVEQPRLTFEEVSLDGVSPPVRRAMLALELGRSGTGSLFGNIEVRPRGQRPIGAIRGLGVYPEIDRRSVRVPLERVPTSGETLEIVFTDDDVDPGRVLARTSFRVP